jgi:hypothetical protein
MNRVRRRKRLTLPSIYRFIERSRMEMKKCEKARAHLAIIVLVGATLEYILAAYIRAYPHVVYSQHKRLTDHWDLKNLNQLARQSGLFDYRAFQASERIRKSRNLVHPNWYAGRKPTRFTQGIVDKRLSDYNSVIDSIQRNL